VDAFLGSKSVDYLASTGQLSDLDFILEHVDDIHAVFPLDNDHITTLPGMEVTTSIVGKPS
jgi:hypothetical protein